MSITICGIRNCGTTKGACLAGEVRVEYQFHDKSTGIDNGGRGRAENSYGLES